MFDSRIDDARSRLATLAAALDDVAALDVAAFDHREIAELTATMHGMQSRMDAQTDRVVGAFDVHGDPGRAVTTAAWLADTCRLPKARARVSVSRARALKHMPEVASAYESGAITSDHVRLLAAAHRSNAEAFAKAEEELVDDASTLRFDHFARRVSYFRQIADPDGTEQEAQDAFERRNLHCSRTFEETVQLDALFDPIGGSIFKNEHDRIEKELFEADWKEARERLGDAATAGDLRRTPAQRRLDAAVEMARRSAAMPADARQARVLLTILVGYETFAGRMCQLADGTVVTPGQVAALFPDLDIDAERVVFDGPSRVLDVGVRRRLFVGATRRAVEVRDLECDEATCDVPYERCEVDHIQPFATDGLTVQENGRLRCPRHHSGRRRERPPPVAPPPPPDPEDQHDRTG